MSKVIAGLAGMAVLCASMSTAHAQASQNIDLQATVPKFCKIGSTAANTNPTTIVKQFTAAPGAGEVSAVLTENLGTVVCNSSVDVALQSTRGAIIQGLGPAVSNSPAGFQNFIAYGATLSAPYNASVSASGSPVTGPTVTLTPQAVTNVTVTITPAANALDLLASTTTGAFDYTDTLVVSFTPQ